MGQNNSSTTDEKQQQQQQQQQQQHQQHQPLEQRDPITMKKARAVTPIDEDSTTFHDLEERIREHARSQIFRREFDALEHYEYSLSVDRKKFFKSALAAHGLGKNRYSNVFANEHSRCCLPSPADGNGDDYINANLIPGSEFSLSTHSWIATQAPLDGTFADYWSMVWTYDVPIIVMLTQVIEKGMIKADRYWPKAVGTVEQHGNYQVQLVAEKTIPEDSIIVRDLVVTKQDEQKQKQIRFFQYTGWPDHGVPANSTALLHLIDMIDETYLNLSSSSSVSSDDLSTTTTTTTVSAPAQPRPIIVHCSAGIGRTGSLIAIHITILQLKQHFASADASTRPFTFNVFKTVKTLKYHRIGMVYQPDQYVFCHTAILDAHKKLLLQKKNSTNNNDSDNNRSSN